MTTYSYAQLEGLWIDAGGSRALAPLMAAIAEAESSGNSEAENPSGASGLWQILGAPDGWTGSTDWFNPQVNAKAAVAKYKTQGLSAWSTYTSGAYEQFLKGKVPPNLNTGGGSGGQGGSGQPATLTAAQGGSLLGAAGSLLHGSAVVLDRAFALFAPGQGWRLLFAAAAVVLFLLSFRAFTGVSA